MSDTPADLVIRTASRHGYIIMQGGEDLAAFSTARELADWIAQELEPRPEIHDPVTMPNVVKAGWLRGKP